MNAGKAEKINRFIRDFGRVAVAIGPGEWRLFFEHGATYGRAPAKHLNAICARRHCRRLALDQRQRVCAPKGPPGALVAFPDLAAPRTLSYTLPKRGRVDLGEELWVFFPRLLKHQLDQCCFPVPGEADDGWGKTGGLHCHVGQIVDTGLVAAPRQRNTDDEKKAIKLSRRCAHARRGCLVLAEGFGLWRNLSRAVRGICANQLDPSSDSLATVSSELADYVGTGYLGGVTTLYALLSQEFLAKHQLAPAREVISKGLGIAERTSERFFEAELLHLKARALGIEGGPGVSTEAQKLLEESLAVARSQNARSLELRAAVSLARLRRDQGRSAEARDLLAPVYGWFTEGFDTPDLKEAKALIELEGG